MSSTKSGSSMQKAVASKKAIQEQFLRDNYCWGCGRLNGHGLQLKSYWLGSEAVATWQPKSYHAAGPPDVVNGGIIATLIDCHSACTAMAAAYQAEGREIGTEPHIWCATASLQVTYLRPTPIGEPLSLRARVRQMAARKIVVSCSVFSGQQECARGEVVSVRVQPEWTEAK